MSAARHETKGAYFEAAFDGVLFDGFQINDHDILGRQILTAMKLRPADSHLIVEVKDGGTSPLGLDESIDLKKETVSKFIVFRDDELRRFFLNDVEAYWGRRTLKAAEVRVVGRIPDGDELVLERVSEPDKVLVDDDEIDLGQDGSEKLFSRSAYVDVCLDGEERSIRRGRYSVDQLLQLLGVAAGYLLSFVNAEGQLQLLKPGDSVVVNEKLQFFSQVPCGASS